MKEPKTVKLKKKVVVSRNLGGSPIFGKATIGDNTKGGFTWENTEISYVFEKGKEFEVKKEYENKKTVIANIGNGFSMCITLPARAFEK